MSNAIPQCTAFRLGRRLAGAAVWLLASLPAYADLAISVVAGTAPPGSTGNSLEIDLTNTGAAAEAIGAFSFELGSLTGDLHFTAADTGTTGAAYIFAGDSLFGPAIGTGFGQSVQASDLFDLPGSVAVGAGATVGLGRVTFDVGSNSSGGSADAVVGDFPATSLTSGDGSDLSFFVTGGGTVHFAASPVPEPDGFVLALAGSLLVAGTACWRRSWNSLGGTRAAATS